MNSQSGQGLSYIVERMKQSCTCNIKCQFCSACAYMYTCTCLDACTNTTVCKHMHLIHMQSQSVSGTSLTSTTTDLEYYGRISATPFPVLSSQPASDTVIKRIEKRITDILFQCHSCKDIDILDQAYYDLVQYWEDLEMQTTLTYPAIAKENLLI